jgi:hypothetical protein
MPCCQTPPRTRSTTERDDLDRTDAIQPYLIFIYAWSGRRPMNNSAIESAIGGILRAHFAPWTETALSAFARYGKGRGHPAQLNLGDCFAYAAAKNHRRALLFKGDDFDKTDIRSAPRAR